MLSSIWDTCPDIKPSLLGADEWFAGALIPGHWEECGPYLEKSNVGVVVSTPVSGDTFTWTFGSTLQHTVTVSSVDATVTGTKTTGGSGGSDVTTTSSATGTGGSDAKPGMGSSLTVPFWTIAGSVGVLILSAL